MPGLDFESRLKTFCPSGASSASVHASCKIRWEPAGRFPFPSPSVKRSCARQHSATSFEALSPLFFLTQRRPGLANASGLVRQGKRATEIPFCWFQRPWGLSLPGCLASVGELDLPSQITVFSQRLLLPFFSCISAARAKSRRRHLWEAMDFWAALTLVTALLVLSWRPLVWGFRNVSRKSQRKFSRPQSAGLGISALSALFPVVHSFDGIGMGRRYACSRRQFRRAHADFQQSKELVRWLRR